MRPAIVLACLGLGLATEAIAWALGWWVYDPWWLRLVNVAAVFGGVLGWLTSRLADAPWWQRFATGAVFGIAYEAANVAALGWWTFPGDRLFWLHGPVALVLGVGLAWGAVPVMAGLAPTTASAARPAARRP